MQGIWWGLEVEQVHQDHDREGVGSGVGSGEKRLRELWNEKKYDRVWPPDGEKKR